MATFTPNLNLEQQGSTERASLVVLNSNLGKLDTFAGTVNGKIGKLSTPPAYSADCNDIDETCVVYVTDSATNSPGPWNILTTTVFDASNAISQIAVDIIRGGTKARSKNGNGWSEWTVLDNVNRSRENSTVYSFYAYSNASAYRLAVLFQHENGHPAMHLLSMGTGDTPTVTVLKVFGDESSHSPSSVTMSNGILTINYASTAYGGVSLLWLD